MTNQEVQVGTAKGIDILLLDEIDNAQVAVKKLDAAAFMVDAIAEYPGKVDPNALEGLAHMISESARTLELLAVAACKSICEA